MDAFKKSVTTQEVQAVASGASESKADLGPAIYKADCAMCHGENLEGGIGPALTGPKFVYGGTLANHIRVITDGTPKGMPGFGKQLGPEKVRAVAHYIHFRHAH
jgi:cytochrome c oxidase cbb3-type subunit 3